MPRSERAHRGFKLAALAACGAGAMHCGPPVNEFEGQHVLVLADSGLELCGGSLAHMDQFVSVLAEKFALDPPVGDERLEFRWLREENAALSPCPARALGCEVRGQVFSVWAPLNHELVHALAEAYGAPPPFFAEGLAEAFQGLSPQGRDALDAPVGAFGTVWESLHGKGTSLNRALAAGFVSTLVETHGLANFLAVYASLSPSATDADIDAAFREELGTTLAESVAKFEATAAACTRAEVDAKLMECSAPAVEWDGSRFELFRRLDCEQRDALGPYDGDLLQVLGTLDVEVGGTFELRVIAERPDAYLYPSTAAMLTPCRGCGGGPGILVEAGNRIRASLAPGRYSLRLLGPATTSTSIGVRLERVPEPAPEAP